MEKKFETNLSIEDKMLLIQDLSARLPYAVKVEHSSGFIGTLQNINTLHLYNGGDDIEDIDCDVDFFGDSDYIGVEYFRPYLFPMDSMTDEQQKELNNIGWYFDGDTIANSENYYSEYTNYITHIDCIGVINWLNKNHFDYRGLIEKGLALDATNKNIY
jgi:hypothetical protein